MKKLLFLVALLVALCSCAVPGYRYTTHITVGGRTYNCTYQNYLHIEPFAGTHVEWTEHRLISGGSLC